ncbi:hypothetical protein F5Y17DRAFT_427244 [Xylariaceae sp. FL0594]|nr:hypothetical protein F5Y17DRAFT_427244 [Xylariaceae sp. FL0594]
MPYSDNMYSTSPGGDESDSESFTNELSPADGYFPGTSSSNDIHRHVPNRYVSDPTLEERTRREAENKAREAADESGTDPAGTSGTLSTASAAAAAAAAGPLRRHPLVTYAQSQSSASQPLYTSSSSTSSHIHNPARAPSLYSEAPPAYTPRNYNTFGTRGIMGVPDEERARLLPPEPESIGAPIDEDGGAPTTSWANRARRRVPAWFRWRFAALVVLVVVLVVPVMVLATRSSSSSSPGNTDGDSRGAPVGKDPLAPHPPSDNPGDDMPPPSAQTPFTPFHCRDGQHRYDDQVLPLDFSASKNVSFLQQTERHPGVGLVHVTGQVIVRRLAQGERPRIVLQAVSNEPELPLNTSLDENEQRLIVSVPNTFDSSVPSQRVCVELRGTIWAPEDAKLGSFLVHATQLDVLLLDDISLHVADSSGLSSVSGDIRTGISSSEATTSDGSWQLDSRIITVDTVSGNIDGAWPLYDELYLHSTSGTITALITPHAELKERRPVPAILSVSTTSGDITAREPPVASSSPHQVPNRDYRVDIKSMSGDVKGALAFGTSAKVHTTSGDITLDLLPVAKGAPAPSKLETVSTSGKLAVRVLEPLVFNRRGGGGDADVLDWLDSTHRSTSGDVHLWYPQAWEGTLTAKTTSGDLRTGGKDLHIISRKGGWVGSQIVARKGTPGQKSTVDVRCTSGDVDAVIGDRS